jgi:hypothetical protein
MESMADAISTSFAVSLSAQCIMFLTSQKRWVPGNRCNGHVTYFKLLCPWAYWNLQHCPSFLGGNVGPLQIFPDHHMSGKPVTGRQPASQQAKQLLNKCMK